jgi:hypothetical protein
MAQKPTLPDVAPPEPSQTLVGGPPTPDDSHAGDANTAVDVKAMSKAEAERVLQWTGFTQEEIPTTKSPDKKSAGPPPFAPNTLKGVAPPPSRPPPMPPVRPAAGAPIPPMRRTPSAAPAPPGAPGRRPTLMLDGSPPEPMPAEASEHSAIIVPAAGAQAPKAVTQPPPWGEGAVQVKDIPRAAAAPPPPMRPREPSAEELSGSMLLPADEDPKGKLDEAEELSGSVLLDEPAAPRPGSIKTAPGFAVPRAHHGPTKQSPQVPAPKLNSSIPPPLPKTSTRPQSSMPPPLPVPPAPSSSPKTIESPQAAVNIPAPAPLPSRAPVPPHVPTPSFSPAPPPVAAAPAVPERPPVFDPSLPAGVPVPDQIELPPPPGWPPPSMSAHPSPQSPSHAPALGVPTIPSERPPSAGEAAEQNVIPRRFLNLPPWSALLDGNRPKWFLPAVAAGGFIVGVGLIGLIIGAVRGGDSSSAAPSKSKPVAGARATSTSSSPAATTTTASTAAAPANATTAASPPAAVTSTAPCKVAGDAHTIAANGTIAAGVEVASLDGDLALGFATSPKDALAVRLDPDSFAAKAQAHGRSTDPLRRVTPYVDSRHTFALLADADKKLDRVAGRRGVAAALPFDLGGTGGQVVAVARGALGGGARVWSLDGDGGAPEQIRAVRVPGTNDNTYAIAYRRAGAIWIGVASGDKPSQLAARGSLARVAGLGGTPLGSPSIAASGTTVLVAWADHDAASSPYSIRYVLFDVSGSPGDAATFSLPPGGEGTQGMSPGVAGVSGDRFVIVWTEGAEGRHQVRMETLGKDGHPLGAATTLSPSGVNAGQGQAAATEGGHGAAAFLQESGNLFEIIAVPLSCPP